MNTSQINTLPLSTQFRTEPLETERINCDTYGNPRIIIHYTQISTDYEKAKEIAKTQHGTVYRSKRNKGYFVFTSGSSDFLTITRKLFVEMDGVSLVKEFEYGEIPEFKKFINHWVINNHRRLHVDFRGEKGVQNMPLLRDYEHILGLPYTSSGSFAAIWADTNYHIFRYTSPNKTQKLVGFSYFTDGINKVPVAIFDYEYQNKNGEWVEDTEYRFM